jgi:hypothetical protein
MTVLISVVTKARIVTSFLGCHVAGIIVIIPYQVKSAKQNKLNTYIRTRITVLIQTQSLVKWKSI